MTFVHKKRYGQNFLTDINLLKAIVSDAGVDNNSEVLEIGPGLGSLTNELSLSAKKVVSYEIDRELIPILNTKFENSNVKIINADIMNVTIDDIEKIRKDFDKTGRDNLHIFTFPQHDHDLNFLQYIFAGAISEGLQCVFDKAQLL